jgi:HSP20 family protein
MLRELASQPPPRNPMPPNQVTRIIDQLQKGYNNFFPSEVWTPNVNLYETETAYHVCVDLAGVDKSKIDIDIVESRLTIRGSRSVPTRDMFDSDGNPRRVRVHLMEIDHGAFTREVELPDDVLPADITAVHHNGMLWVELPRKR